MTHAGSPGFDALILSKFPWICALWLHLGVFALVVSFSVPKRLETKLQSPISVDLVPSPELHQKTSQASGPGDVPLANTPTDQKVSLQSSEPLGALKPQPVWVKATSFLAGNVLNDPRSAQARTALVSLIGMDQREQLCALEAMEQVRRHKPGFLPTRLAPHAIRNSSQMDNSLSAPAAALRSKGIWYEIAYRCTLDDTGKEIRSFEFSLNAPIDRARWENLGLAPVH